MEEKKEKKGKKKVVKTGLLVKKSKTVYCENSSCFAARKSKKNAGKHFCIALADNDFKGKPCPFFKTMEQHMKDLETAEQRRIRLAQERAKSSNIKTISGVIFTKKGEKKDE